MVCSHNQIVLSANVTIAPDSLIVNPQIVTCVVILVSILKKLDSYMFTKFESNNTPRYLASSTFLVGCQ